MSEQINIYEAKTQLSRLVDRAVAGEDVVIARAGKPLVRLVPVNGPVSSPETVPPRKGGQLKGLNIPDDAFFDPLPEDELALWE